MFRHKDKDQQVEADTSAIQAEVNRLSAMSPVALAIELMEKAYTGHLDPDNDEPPWSVVFGKAPTAYDVANWLYVPRSHELDTSQPVELALFGLVSEALQVLEHASLIRPQLIMEYQGRLGDARMKYALTRYGVSVRDAGAVERVLNGGTLVPA